jgi:hypothetical protein
MPVNPDVYAWWENTKTRHGFPADLVISALQKELRRGHRECRDARLRNEYDQRGA